MVLIANESEPAMPRQWRLWRPGRADVVALLFVVLATLGASALVVRAERHFGPIDEFQHFDYVTELVYHHRVPLPGDVFTQEAMRTFVCHSAPAGPNAPRCSDTTFNPADFQTGGRVTAGGEAPAYYVPTAVVAWLAAKVTGAKDLFYATRLASVLWLLLGTVVVYLLARSFAAGRLLASAIALGSALGPLMLYQGSTTNPDSMSLLAGAGTAAAWLRWRGSTSRRSWIAMAALLTFVAMIKPNFIVVPVAVALAELVIVATGGRRALLNRRTWAMRMPLMRMWTAAAVAVGASVLWSIWFRYVAVPPSALTPPGARYGAQHWNTGVALIGWGKSLYPQTDLPPLLHKGEFMFLSAVVDALFIAGVLAAAVLARRRMPAEDRVSSGLAPSIDPLRALGVLAVVSLVIAAPMVYAIVAASGAFIVYPPRYSMFIVPLGLVALGTLAVPETAVRRFLAAQVSLDTAAGARLEPSRQDAEVLAPPQVGQPSDAAANRRSEEGPDVDAAREHPLMS